MTTRKEYLTCDDLSGRAIITGILQEGRVVRLEKTLFHAQGGGQRSDIGEIAGTAVVAVKHAEGGEVDHHLAAALTVAVGNEVDISIDEASRRINARYHSAGHLIADAVEDLGLNLKAIQGHHWPGEARVEFEGGDDEIVPNAKSIQAAVDKLIEQDVSFEIIGDPFSSRALKIGAFSPVGCGGTHVKSSGALSRLTISKIKRRKGRLRISYSM